MDGFEANEMFSPIVADTGVLGEVQPAFVALTKYVLVKVIEGVVNEVPVPTAVPPTGPVNHDRVPAEPIAPITRTPGSQRFAGVVLVIVGVGVTTTVTLAVFTQEGNPPVTV